MPFLVEILAWLPVGAVPIVNGLLRLGTYQKLLGEPAASIVSSCADMVLVYLYARWLARLGPVNALRRGVTWLALTTATHFGLGLLVFGMAVGQLLAKYRIQDGETWLVVTVFVFLAPLLAAPGRRP
ncbi:MAG: hypothetical protein FJ265_02390 [Planctomycetes bacterium]|nr:hypothetical protein [Planctomycetota bacterium]